MLMGFILVLLYSTVIFTLGLKSLHALITSAVSLCATVMVQLSLVVPKKVAGASSPDTVFIAVRSIYLWC